MWCFYLVINVSYNKIYYLFSMCYSDIIVVVFYVFYMLKIVLGMLIYILGKNMSDYLV